MKKVFAALEVAIIIAVLVLLVYPSVSFAEENQMDDMNDVSNVTNPDGDSQDTDEVVPTEGENTINESTQDETETNDDEIDDNNELDDADKIDEKENIGKESDDEEDSTSCDPDIDAKKGNEEVDLDRIIEPATQTMSTSAPSLNGAATPQLTLYQSGDKWYIRDESTGKNLKGQWVTIGNQKYYASDYEYLWQSRTINMAGKNYYVGDDCSVQYGVVYAKNKGNYYFADPKKGGAFAKGQWVDYNGKKYYASDSEPLHRNRTINMDKKNYYVGDDCSVVMGKVVYDKNRDKYYYGAPGTGSYVKGQWVDYNGKKYYASDSEPLHRSRTINMDGKNYYVGDDCSVQYGVLYVKSNGNYYFADPQKGGAFAKGQWVDYNGKKYYASDSEQLHRNRTINMDKKNYYVGDDCSVVMGKVVYDKNRDKYYYGAPSTGSYVKGQWVDYNGKKCYASDNEYLHRSRFINQAGKNYYVGDDCSIVKGKRIINGIEYYFDSDTGALCIDGWGIIEGKKYYFVDKNYVTGQQLIDGRQYYFNNAGVLRSRAGIDVSEWQGSIDWKKVKADGIDFVFIRVGGRFWGPNRTSVYMDDYAIRNLQGATDAGLDIGAYFFTQAISVEEALEEAEFTVNVLKGYNLTMPVVIDTEPSGGDKRHNTIDKRVRTDIVKAFCEHVEASGYTAMYYAGIGWSKDHLIVSELDDKWDHWVPQYYKECQYRGKYKCWQYSSSGSVAGVRGNCDMNIWYLDK